MKLSILIFILFQFLLNSNKLLSQNFEEGMLAYNKGDFAKAFNIWKPMADKGNASAQLPIALMLDRGEGVVGRRGEVG